MAQNPDPSSDPSNVLRITREFDAPRELVWRVWTEHEHLMRWFCPKDFKVLFFEADPRPGGKWRSAMRSPDGNEFIHHGVYEQVAAPHRLVFTHTWEKNHLEPDADTRVTVTLTEQQAGRTTMVFEQIGLATAESRDSHRGGWSEAFDNLAEHLDGVPEPTAERELVISRVFNAPPELVWQAFADREHIGQWWGPDGFTTTTHHMDFQPGGVWRFDMHGPDGHDYPNRIVYDEISEPHRLVFTHEDAEGVEPVRFRHTITFKPHGEHGRQTKLTMRMVFPTAKHRDEVVRKHGAVEGGIQTLGRLAAQIAAQAGGDAVALTLALPSEREIMVSRVFNAPRRMVFDAFTKPEHVRQWLSGLDEWPLVQCEIDLQVGGVMRYVWRHAEKGQCALSGVFQEIMPPERIVHTERFDDDWTGSETRVTTTFTETPHETDRTTTAITVRYASQAARDGALGTGMIDGMARCYDRLAGWLAALPPDTSDATEART